MKKFLLVVLPLALVAAATIGACSPAIGRRRTGAATRDRAVARAEPRRRRARDQDVRRRPAAATSTCCSRPAGIRARCTSSACPSMRLLKTIAVFTPEPWQGYGYGADWSEMSLAGDRQWQRPRAARRARNGNGNAGSGNGNGPKEPLRWGDSHHPALSETAGKYDGRWLYINDRAHGRIGMVDLSDFRAKQIMQVPNLQTSHGGVFATPNRVRPHLVEGAGAEGVEREQGADARRSTIT